MLNNIFWSIERPFLGWVKNIYLCDAAIPFSAFLRFLLLFIKIWEREKKNHRIYIIQKLYKGRFCLGETFINLINIINLNKIKSTRRQFKYFKIFHTIFSVLNNLLSLTQETETKNRKCLGQDLEIHWCVWQEHLLKCSDITCFSWKQYWHVHTCKFIWKNASPPPPPKTGLRKQFTHNHSHDFFYSQKVVLSTRQILEANEV